MILGISGVRFYLGRLGDGAHLSIQPFDFSAFVGLGVDGKYLSVAGRVLVIGNPDV